MLLAACVSFHFLRVGYTSNVFLMPTKHSLRTVQVSTNADDDEREKEEVQDDSWRQLLEA